MREIGKFNTELLLFQEELPPLKTETLLFIRWLAEKQGKTHSEPAGELALALRIIHPDNVSEKMNQHLAANGDY